MAKRIGMEVAIAVAEAVGLCDIDMAAVYPITPQSHIAEHLSDLVADGEIDAEFVTVESEHSAMSAVIGASGAGALFYGDQFSGLDADARIAADRLGDASADLHVHRQPGGLRSLEYFK